LNLKNVLNGFDRSRRCLLIATVASNAYYPKPAYPSPAYYPSYSKSYDNVIIFYFYFIDFT